MDKKDAMNATNANTETSKEMFINNKENAFMDKKKNAMNINVDTLSEMLIDNDIIITLNLAPIMPQRKQIRLVEKFHIISDSDYGYKHVYLYKPTVKSPNYMLGIDFRNVFFNKRLYFNQNIITYINACKSYALNTYLALQKSLKRLRFLLRLLLGLVLRGQLVLLLLMHFRCIL